MGQIKLGDKTQQAKEANPQIQNAVEDITAEKRAALLKDAQSALAETHNAVRALDQGRKDEALSELEKVTGKLDLIEARDQI